MIRRDLSARLARIESRLTAARTADAPRAVVPFAIIVGLIRFLAEVVGAIPRRDASDEDFAAWLNAQPRARGGLRGLRELVEAAIHDGIYYAPRPWNFPEAK